MAFVTTTFFSPVLGFKTDMNVIVPTPDSDEVLNHKDTSYFYSGVRFPVLYLLHGAYGDYSDWARLTGIERYAKKHRIVVVMPSASNSFYQDMYMGSAYDTFITQEVPQFVETYFPVSKKAEDRYLAGLSMGGYGALHLGFKYPERYAALVSLSGAVDLKAVIPDGEAALEDSPFHWEAMFEDPSNIIGTEADVLWQAEQAKAAGVELPPVFQSCGTEDFLHNANVTAFKHFEELGLSVTYDETAGIHDWDYWDASIQRALDWIDERRK